MEISSNTINILMQLEVMALVQTIAYVIIGIISYYKNDMTVLNCMIWLCWFVNSANIASLIPITMEYATKYFIAQYSNISALHIVMIVLGIFIIAALLISFLYLCARIFCNKTVHCDN